MYQNKKPTQFPPSIKINPVERQSAKGNLYEEVSFKMIRMLDKNRTPTYFVSETMKRPVDPRQMQTQPYQGQKFAPQPAPTQFDEVPDAQNDNDDDSSVPF